MMWKKLILNVCINLVLICSSIGIVWSWQHKHYAFIVGLGFVFILFVYFKINMIKEVRSKLK